LESRSETHGEFWNAVGYWRRMEKISWTDHVRNEEESRRREITYIQKKKKEV
jgi:hypothetical protein